MATIRRSISIHAPVDRVFDYVANPSHLPEIWPSMIEVRNVEPHPTGNSFDWDYKLLGMRIHGHSDPVELVRNERQVTRSVRGIPNTFRWVYTAHDGETDVTLEVDYEVPVLGRLAERLVGRVNEREAETLLANLKKKMEAAPIA
ncbi:MAG: bacterio-opsin linked product [Deltaproteobacteria bacterium]|nr:bacterio-opsin linked product [Deltaproteobacteria bacterium]